MSVLSPREEMDAIRKKMGHFSLDAPPVAWMDTGSPRLNSIFGIEELGIPWGRIIEIFGPESNGKSALAWDLIAIAQAQGAFCIWHDAENSYQRKWARKRGVNTKKLCVVQPYIGVFPKKTKEGKKISKKDLEPSISPAEVLCDEVTELIKAKYRKDPNIKIFYVMDSVTALETAYEMEVGMTDANMKSNTELSRFLSRLLKKWVSLFRTHNVTGVFVNQLRTKPGQAFGNPEYTPGGKALKFYSHVRARIGRAGDTKSRIMQSQKQIGIQGILKSVKNKVGGVENTKIGYKIFFDGSSKYLSPDKIKGDV